MITEWSTWWTGGRFVAWFRLVVQLSLSRFHPIKIPQDPSGSIKPSPGPPGMGHVRQIWSLNEYFVNASHWRLPEHWLAVLWCQPLDRHIWVRWFCSYFVVSCLFPAVKHPAEASMAKAGKHQKWRETAATLLAVWHYVTAAVVSQAQTILSSRRPTPWLRSCGSLMWPAPHGPKCGRLSTMSFPI